MEPAEITSPKALQQRIAADGVITVTRGTFATPIAHTNNCRSLTAIRIPTHRARYWWTPDFGTAATTLGARKCQHCLQPRRYPLSVPPAALKRTAQTRRDLPPRRGRLPRGRPCRARHRKKKPLVL